MRNYVGLPDSSARRNSAKTSCHPPLPWMSIRLWMICGYASAMMPPQYYFLSTGTAENHLLSVGFPKLVGYRFSAEFKAAAKRGRQGRMLCSIFSAAVTLRLHSCLMRNASQSVRVWYRVGLRTCLLGHRQHVVVASDNGAYLVNIVWGLTLRP